MNTLKDTSVRISLVTAAAFIVWMLGASWTVFGYASQIDRNTAAIESVVTSLELSRVDREISGLRKEKRTLERTAKGAAGNMELQDLLDDQVQDIEDEIEFRKLVRSCIVNPNQKVCE